MRLTVSVNKSFCDRDPKAFNFVTEGAWDILNTDPISGVAGEGTEDQNECIYELSRSTDATTLLAAFSTSLRQYKACLPEGTPNKVRPGIGVTMVGDSAEVDATGARMSDDPEDVHILIGLSEPSAD